MFQRQRLFRFLAVDFIAKMNTQKVFVLMIRKLKPVAIATVPAIFYICELSWSSRMTDREGVKLCAVVDVRVIICADMNKI